jgi:hypothetical protein
MNQRYGSITFLKTKNIQGRIELLEPLSKVKLNYPLINNPPVPSILYRT